MVKFAVLLIPVLSGLLVLRLLLKPLKLGLKLALHSAAGIACLTIMNALSAASGILIPINAVTTTVAALLGLPGIAGLAALALIP